MTRLLKLGLPDSKEACRNESSLLGWLHTRLSLSVKVQWNVSIQTLFFYTAILGQFEAGVDRYLVLKAGVSVRQSRTTFKALPFDEHQSLQSHIDQVTSSD